MTFRARCKNSNANIKDEVISVYTTKRHGPEEVWRHSLFPLLGGGGRSAWQPVVYLVSVQYEAEWAPESVWRFWGIDLSPLFWIEKESLCCVARSLATLPTDTSLLLTHLKKRSGNFCIVFRAKGILVIEKERPYNVRMNVILRRVRATIPAVEEQ
jgi:hypothetical protein